MISLNDLCPSCGTYVPAGHNCTECRRVLEEGGISERSRPFPTQSRTMSPRARRRGWAVLLINLITLMLIFAIVIIAVCAAGEAVAALLWRAI